MTHRLGVRSSRRKCALYHGISTRPPTGLIVVGCRHPGTDRRCEYCRLVVVDHYEPCLLVVWSPVAQCGSCHEVSRERPLIVCGVAIPSCLVVVRAKGPGASVLHSPVRPSSPPDGIGLRGCSPSGDLDWTDPVCRMFELGEGLSESDDADVLN